MRETFGADLDFDPNDLFDGHYERRVQSAIELGIPLDSPAIRDTVRKVRELSPRYRFRVRTAGGPWYSGEVDRYGIRVGEPNTPLPEPLRSQVVAFLRSLTLGKVQVRA
jgi:hypothetical protein